MKGELIGEAFVNDQLRFMGDAFILVRVIAWISMAPVHCGGKRIGKYLFDLPLAKHAAALARGPRRFHAFQGAHDLIRV